MRWSNWVRSSATSWGRIERAGSVWLCATCRSEDGQVCDFCFGGVLGASVSCVETLCP